MLEHMQELVEGSNWKRKEYGTIMSEASEKGLEHKVKISWRYCYVIG